MKYNGVSAQRRKQLARLLAAGKGAITIDCAAQILQWEREKARALLSSLNRSGWLKLIKPGIYVSVPLESDDSHLTQENELVLANYLFAGCYIGGWSAASYWGLTDQIFLKTWVMTAGLVRKKQQTKGQHTYILRHVPETYFFGLHGEWINQDKVLISDPHKTIVDFANFITDFDLQGFIDIFTQYLYSKHKDLDAMLDYARQSMNQTIYKRLGFMLEKFDPESTIHINECKKNISKGPSKLSPNSICDVYIKKWHLQVPGNMVNQ